MMATIYYDSDCNLELIKGKVIGVIGYGSQGHAHALNLKDSGCKVIVGLREGSKSWKDAKSKGLKVATVADMAAQADIIMMLAPDQSQREIYYQSVEKELTAGKTLMFAHGFNIHYGQITPPANIDVSMIAPKCPGHMLRQVYTEGKGAPAIVAVHQDASGNATDIALAYANGIGCSR
ncbi:MAG: ketol-acid reductoisomerase, partial [Dehalococcoidia bacterium]|nr:ketol-acid reductoisomerase [Dehalococcoidia bacterium]